MELNVDRRFATYHNYIKGHAVHSVWVIGLRTEISRRLEVSLLKPRMSWVHLEDMNHALGESRSGALKALKDMAFAKMFTLSVSETLLLGPTGNQWIQFQAN